MDAKKRKRLEAARWKTTNVQEFLNLGAADMTYIETKFALSHRLRSVREKRRLTQTALATALNTSQSRVAKMEHGERSKRLVIGALPAKELAIRITAKGMRSLRRKLRLTQAEFARLAGVSTPTVWQWEKKTGALKVRGETNIFVADWND